MKIISRSIAVFLACTTVFMLVMACVEVRRHGWVWALLDLLFMVVNGYNTWDCWQYSNRQHRSSSW